MCHEIILKNVRLMPEHQQKMFEEMRIFLGMENAYKRLCEIRKELGYA